jgi:hypothetical protein
MPDVFGKPDAVPEWYSVLPTAIKDAGIRNIETTNFQESISPVDSTRTRREMDELARTTHNAEIAYKNGNYRLFSQLSGTETEKVTAYVNKNNISDYDPKNIEVLAKDEEVQRMAFERDEFGKLKRPHLAKIVGTKEGRAFKADDLWQIMHLQEAITPTMNVIDNKWGTILGQRVINGTKSIIRSGFSIMAAAAEVGEAVAGVDFTAMKREGKTVYAPALSSLGIQRFMDTLIPLQKTEDTGSTVENFVGDVAENTPQIVAAVLGGVAIKGLGFSVNAAKTAMGLLAAAQSSGQAFDELRDVDISRKALPVMALTAASTLLEKFRLGKMIFPEGNAGRSLAKVLGPKGMLMFETNLGKAALGAADELATGFSVEAAQTALENLTSATAKALENSAKNNTSFDTEFGRVFSVKDTVQESIYAGLIGGVFGGIGVAKIIMDFKQHQDVLSDIEKIANTRENVENKEAFDKAIKPLVDSIGGKVTTSLDPFILKEKLGEEATQALMKNLGIIEQYEAALNNQEDLVITTDELIKAGKSFKDIKAIVTLSTLDPLSMNKFNSTLDEALSNDIARRSKLLKEDVESVAYQEKILEIKQALKGSGIKVAGRPVGDVHARALAALIQANATVLSEATGQDVDEIIKQSPKIEVRVKGQEVISTKVTTDDFTDLNKLQSSEWGETQIVREGQTFRAKDYVTSLVSRVNNVKAVLDCMRKG